MDCIERGERVFWNGCCRLKSKLFIFRMVFDFHVKDYFEENESCGHKSKLFMCAMVFYFHVKDYFEMVVVDTKVSYFLLLWFSNGSFCLNSYVLLQFPC
jgi:hypothetical protein